MSSHSIRAALTAIGALAALGSPVDAQSWRTITSARQLWGTEPVTVHVEYGAGHLEIASADRATLYRMEMRYDEGHFSPITSFDEGSRTLRLGVKGKEGRRGIKMKEGSKSTISLTREVPMNLELNFGAGEADIDLGGMRLRRLELSTGASETKVRFDSPNPIRADRVEIHSGAADLKVYGLGNARAGEIDFQGGVGATLLDFTGAWQGSSTATVKMGIGSVTLRFPRDLGVRIEKSSFLTSFEADGMVKRDGAFFSRNWDTAKNRLTLDVEAALGSIEVDWVD